ncbi:MAG TPA: exodeoxyribonuclease VII large subunit [Bacteroidales bacterium]|nr:exodeoxyribonuclease VII large subunit [Bacteroidales bacterium]HSA42806.1 exodeoxyribonuclease VII large subunit [Bacteroidales bacterium]
MDETRGMIRLSELTSLLEDTIREEFLLRPFLVVAETSDIRNYPDRGYCFLNLLEKDGKEIHARMAAVIWSRNHHIIAAFESATGMRFDRNLKVLLQGTVDYSPVYGLQFQITAIEPSFTLGEMERQRQAILNSLCSSHPAQIRQVEGNYVTANQQLRLPAVIQRIALITAPGSDGWKDFRHELESNPFAYTYVCDDFLCRIQGKGAEDEIIEQMGKVTSSKRSYDLLVLVRGGGGQTDFGPFDTYELGLAVATFPVPVVCGIGHERNVSISDLMCHMTVKTPTKAAAFINQHNYRFEEEIRQRGDAIIRLATGTMDRLRSGLDNMAIRITQAARHYLLHRMQELDKAGLIVKHLDPATVLARGYAMVSSKAKVITRAAQLQVGAHISIRMQDGFIDSDVTQIQFDTNESSHDIPESLG